MLLLLLLWFLFNAVDLRDAVSNSSVLPAKSQDL